MINEPWESGIRREISAQGSFKVLRSEEQITQEWHNRSHVSVNMHASVSFSCLCGRNATGSKSHSRATRSCPSLLITLTQRKPECFYIPQQVSFQRVWLDSLKMSRWTGAAVVTAAINSRAVKVRMRLPTPRMSWRNGFTFPDGPIVCLCFIFST